MNKQLLACAIIVSVIGGIFGGVIIDRYAAKPFWRFKDPNSFDELLRCTRETANPRFVIVLNGDFSIAEARCYPSGVE